MDSSLKSDIGTGALDLDHVSFRAILKFRLRLQFGVLLAGGIRLEVARQLLLLRNLRL